MSPVRMTIAQYHDTMDGLHIRLQLAHRARNWNLYWELRAAADNVLAMALAS